MWCAQFTNVLIVLHHVYKYSNIGMASLSPSFWVEENAVVGYKKMVNGKLNQFHSFLGYSNAICLVQNNTST